MPEDKIKILEATVSAVNATAQVTDEELAGNDRARGGGGGNIAAAGGGVLVPGEQFALHNAAHNRFMRMNDKGQMDGSGVKAATELLRAYYWARAVARSSTRWWVVRWL